MKKICAILLILLWAGLAAFSWFGPAKDISEAERRPLAQMPEINADTVLGGSFMADFEDFTLDQFPLRDAFRQLKSVFHQYVLGQKDNNGIYIAEGYAVKQEYPLNETSVEHFLNRVNYLYEKYLTNSKVTMAIVPDKGYYLGQPSGHLTMDYDRLYAMLEEGMPWAEHIDLRDALSAEDYYRTDTHWRQENLIPAAGVLAEALGVTAPRLENFTPVTVERPFYGVYYGQAALPMEAEEMVYLDSDLLSQCRVYDHESGKTGDIYDLQKAETAKDQYDMFLSGAKSLLTIENPSAGTDRELIVFRDSFGSSIIPLLVEDYAKVTVVDIRYIRIDVLDRFLEFKGKDVLMLYSALVLNASTQIQ